MTAGASADTATATPFSLPAYRNYWAARFLASFAVQIITVAVGWQLYDATRDPFLLGMVGLAEFLPSLVLVLATGAASDHFDRRSIAVVCLLLEALCGGALLWIYLAGGTPLLPLFTTLIALGIVRAFIAPALQSLVTSLVPRQTLSSAIAWNTSSWQIASVTGPMAGGLLYGLGGAVAYGVATLMLTAAVALMLAVPRSTEEASTGSRKTLASLFAGFAYVRREPVVLGAISLDLFAVLLGGAVALMPVYARDILEAGPWGLGMLRAAPGIGAIAMGLWLARFPVTARAGILMFGGVAIFGLFTVVFGLSTTLWLSVLSLLIMGAGDMISVYVRETLIQLATPDDLRGRVNAVNMLFVGASNELGAFRAGTMAAAIGAIPAVVIGGLGTVAVAGLWAWAFPALRNKQSLDR